MPDTLLDVLMLGVAIVTLCVLGPMIWRPFRQRVQEKNEQRKQRAITLSLLETALGQRSTFALECMDDDLKGQELQCTCYSMDATKLTMDVTKAFGSSRWEGMNVRAFFRISYKGKPSYYQFPSRILTVQARGEGFLLSLPLPNMLSPGQKRLFMRIVPQRNSLKGLGIWPVSYSHPLPTSYREMGKAHFNYRNTNEGCGSVRLENISAGGLRLSLNPQVIDEKAIDLGVGAQLLCLLMLQNANGGHPLAFWLVGTIVHNTLTPLKNTDFFLGLRYTNWAQVAPGDAAIEWFPVNKERGVPPLASWIVQHDLEQQMRVGM